MYRSLTGVIPPEAPDRQYQDGLKRPSDLGISLPGKVEMAIMRALNVKEADRFQSVTDFKNALFPPVNKGTDFFTSLFTKTQSQTKGLADTISSYVYTWAKMNPTLTGIRGVYAGQTFALDQDIIFGRDPSNCNIIFPTGTAGISRIHCQICLNVNGQRAVIIDCNSTYGTYLNGMKLYPGQPAILQTGSIISFGTDNVFSFNL